MNPILQIVLVLAAASANTIFCLRAVRWLAIRHANADAATFAADTRDRFRSVWHSQRFTVRGLLLLAIALLDCCGLWWYAPSIAWLPTLTTWLYFCCYFNSWFTPTLNLARQLEQFYVSTSNHPPLWDALIIGAALHAGVKPQLQLRATLNAFERFAFWLDILTAVVVVIYLLCTR